MADQYWNYGAASAPPRSSLDRGHMPKASFPGYLQPETSNFGYDPYNSSIDLRGGSSDFLQKDIVASRPRTYGVDDIVGVRAEPGYKRYLPSSFEEPDLVARYRDVVPGVNAGIPDVGYERAKSVKRPDGDPAPAAESNVLFVDGLPTDCTRRELGHLFRPFIGFKEIRVVHKEPRRHGDKAMVLCFVEFTDAKCAFTALEALQGYKFDDKKPESPLLKIHFAHFPFRLPSDRDEQRFGALR